MISTSIEFTVSGSTYEEIVQKVKEYLAEFLDIDVSDVERKANIEINISDTVESLDEDNYSAEVIAQVKNV